MDEGGGPDLGRGSQPRSEDETESHQHRSTHGTSSDPELGQVARDWIDLWESELSALAIDREARETWQALMPLLTGASMASAAWVSAMAGMLHAFAGQSRPEPARDRPAGCAGAESAARAAAPPAAPDPRDDEIKRLSQHIAELEARLAAVERGDRSGTSGGGRKRKR